MESDSVLVLRDFLSLPLARPQRGTYPGLLAGMAPEALRSATSGVRSWEGVRGPDQLDLAWPKGASMPDQIRN